MKWFLELLEEGGDKEACIGASVPDTQFRLVKSKSSMAFDRELMSCSCVWVELVELWAFK